MPSGKHLVHSDSGRHYDDRWRNASGVLRKASETFLNFRSLSILTDFLRKLPKCIYPCSVNNCSTVFIYISVRLLEILLYFVLWSRSIVEYTHRCNRSPSWNVGRKSITVTYSITYVTERLMFHNDKLCPELPSVWSNQLDAMPSVHVHVFVPLNTFVYSHIV